jgi:hypothetical protein
MTTATKNSARGAPISGLPNDYTEREDASFPTRSDASAGARREGAEIHKKRRPLSLPAPARAPKQGGKGAKEVRFGCGGSEIWGDSMEEEERLKTVLRRAYNTRDPRESTS